MTIETVMDIAPWGVALLTGIIAFKKDWIASQFARKRNEIDVANGAEDVEAKELANVRAAAAASAEIYKDILGEVQKRFDSKVEQLEEDVEKLTGILAHLEGIIKRYKDKYGDLD